jgi:hypothetical protein
MYHLTDGQLLVGVLALLLVVLAVRTVFDYRNEQSAPYRKEQFAISRTYFSSGYQRDLLQLSELSENDDWRPEHETRFTPFRLRDPNSIQPRARVSSNS